MASREFRRRVGELIYPTGIIGPSLDRFIEICIADIVAGVAGECRRCRIHLVSHAPHSAHTWDGSHADAGTFMGVWRLQSVLCGQYTSDFWLSPDMGNIYKYKETFSADMRVICGSRVIFAIGRTNGSRQWKTVTICVCWIKFLFLRFSLVGEYKEDIEYIVIIFINRER